MTNIVIISGSPAEVSRTSALASYLKGVIAEAGHQVKKLAVRDLPPEALIYAQFNHPDIKAAQELVAQADALIAISPVYKASFTGIFKSFFDLIPEKGLAGKKVLPIATGGSIAHLLALEYAFKPLFSVLGTEKLTEGIFIVDSQLTYSGDKITYFDSEIKLRLGASVDHLLKSFEEQKEQVHSIESLR